MPNYNHLRNEIAKFGLLTHSARRFGLGPHPVDSIVEAGNRLFVSATSDLMADVGSVLFHSNPHIRLSDSGAHQSHHPRQAPGGFDATWTSGHLSVTARFSGEPQVRRLASIEIITDDDLLTLRPDKTLPLPDSRGVPNPFTKLLDQLGRVGRHLTPSGFDAVLTTEQFTSSGDLADAIAQSLTLETATDQLEIPRLPTDDPRFRAVVQSAVGEARILLMDLERVTSTGTHSFFEGLEAFGKLFDEPLIVEAAASASRAAATRQQASRVTNQRDAHFRRREVELLERLAGEDPDLLSDARSHHRACTETYEPQHDRALTAARILAKSLERAGLFDEAATTFGALAWLKKGSPDGLKDIVGQARNLRHAGKTRDAAHLLTTNVLRATGSIALAVQHELLICRILDHRTGEARKTEARLLAALSPSFEDFGTPEKSVACNAHRDAFIAYLTEGYRADAERVGLRVVKGVTATSENQPDTSRYWPTPGKALREMVGATLQVGDVELATELVDALATQSGITNDEVRRAFVAEYLQDAGEVSLRVEAEAVLRFPANTRAAAR